MTMPISVHRDDVHRLIDEGHELVEVLPDAGADQPFWRSPDIGRHRRRTEWSPRLYLPWRALR